MTSKCLLILVALLIFPSCVFAQAEAPPPTERIPAFEREIPDTPVGVKAIAFLDVVNSGNRERILDWVKRNYSAEALANFSAEERADFLTGLYLDNRHFSVYRVQLDFPEEVSVIVRSDLTESYYRVHLLVKLRGTFPILSDNFQHITEPHETDPTELRQRPRDPEILKELDAYMRRLSAADVFSGIVFFAKNDQVFFEHAYGLANRTWNQPVSADTKLDIGPLNRLFTAVAVAQLVQQGKLSYEDTLSKVLPEYPNKDVAAKVTVAQLLAGTSGLGTLAEDASEGPLNLQITTLFDLLPQIAAKPLAFAPGSKSNQSDAAYILLGLVIERLSGENYYDYIRKHIYQPAGMHDTDSYALDSEITGLASGYTRQGLTGNLIIGPRHWNLYQRPRRGTPAGNGFSTAADLFRFSKAFREHKLLDAEHTQLLIDGRFGAFGPDSVYAYGFEHLGVKQVRAVGLEGGTVGADAALVFYPEIGYTVIVISNYDPTTAEVVADKLKDLLARPGPEMAPPRAQ